MGCAVCNRPMPEWLRKEFCILYFGADFGKFSSWDDVLGKPPTKARAARGFYENETMTDVTTYMTLEKLEGSPIDNELF